MAQTMRENRIPRPTNRFFARAYPAMAAVRQVISMAITDMNTVLMSQRKAAGAVGPSREPIWYRGALRLVKRFWKLLLTHSVGHQTGFWA